MAATQLDIGLRCIKYLLCAVNALFVLTGVMIISIATTIYAVYDDFQHFLAHSYFSPATMLLVAGIMIFIVAFMGCCGAIRESTCMVLMFAVSMSLILVIEVSAAVAAYFLQDGVKSILGALIDMNMRHYETSGESAYAVNILQSKLRCCGYDSYKDWADILITPENDMGVPNSCCSWYTAADFYYNSTMCANVYAEGCLDRMGIVITRSAVYLGTGATAIALIQLTGIMFACMLGRNIRRQKTERERRRWELRESLVNGYTQVGKTDPALNIPVVYLQSPDFPLTHPNSSNA